VLKLPSGAKALAAALCGTAEAVPFARSPAAFFAEVVPFVLHFSTPQPAFAIPALNTSSFNKSTQKNRPEFGN
jgi:hypothetical protein